MAGQYGMQRMGGVALSAGGTVPQTFNTMPVGHVKRLYLELAFSAKSSAGAFAAVVDTAGSAAAEGVDDLDLILNAVFSSFSLYWTAEGAAFNGFTPAQLRTLLGFLNLRDFAGTFTNGVSVPASGGSATAFKVEVCIPLTLESYFVDGNIFGAGSEALKDGRIEYTSGSSLTPSVVLANGTAAISAVSVSLSCELGGGSASDLGNLWNAQRIASIPTVWTFDSQMRIGLLDTSTVAANAVTAYNVGPNTLISPAQFGAKYQNERLTAGGYDITARCTPLVWIEPSRQFLDFEAMLGKQLTIDAVSGVSSLSLYDIRLVPPSPIVQERVAQRAGAGGPVTVTHPSPKSLPPGSAVPPGLTHILPVRITPGAPAGGPGSKAHRSGPAAVASAAATRAAGAARISSILRLNNPKAQ